MKFLDYLFLSQNIFGVCMDDHEDPQFFRLSDCKIYKGKEPANNWREEYDEKDRRLESYEAKTYEMSDRSREKGTKEGQRRVERSMAKIPFTPIFKNNGLNPRDAKALFNPLDYVVFEGLHERDISKVILFDKKGKTPTQKKLQDNMKYLISEGQYSWQEIVVKNNGEVIVRKED